MSKPKIAFIIPFYNRCAAVANAVKSIIAALRNDIEIILVNDGSTEDCSGILNLARSAGARYVQLDENKGPGEARNAGMDASCAEYIFFLDSDDEICSDKIEALVRELLRLPSGTDVVYIPNYTIIYDNGKSEDRIIPGSFIGGLHDSASFMQSPLLRGSLRINSLIFNSDFIKKNKIRFPSVYYFEDVCFTIPVFYYARRFAVCDILIYRYKFSGFASLTAEKNRKRRLYGAKCLFEYQGRYGSSARAEYKKRVAIMIFSALFMLLEDCMDAEDLYRAMCRHEDAGELSEIAGRFRALFERIRVFSSNYTKAIFTVPANRAAKSIAALIMLVSGRAPAGFFDNLPDGEKARAARESGYEVRALSSYKASPNGVLLVYGAYMLEIKRQLDTMGLREHEDYMLCVIEE